MRVANSYIYVFHLTRYQPDYVCDVLSSGRCAVNVWGAITKEGLGPLVRLPPAFNACAYCELLDVHLIPHALNGPFPDGCFLLQHDYSPIHTARAVQALLEERAVRVLDWTPKGADFNIIENVWGLLKQHMSRLNLVTATPDQLWRAIEAEWDQLRQRDGLVDSLYQSLPQRIAEAISVNGAFTSY